MAKIPMRRTALAGLAMLTALLLTSCYREPSVLAPPPASRAPAPAPAAPAPSAREASSLDEYKIMLAQRIAAANPRLIFSGALPPMLPAIVVVDFAVDHNGEISGLRVHRSRDDDASSIALNAVRAAAPFPKPGKLIKGLHRTLPLTETFLFNRDYLFQLRTLAGPQ